MDLGMFVTGHTAPQILFSPGDQYVARILAVSVRVDLIVEQIGVS